MSISSNLFSCVQWTSGVRSAAQFEHMSIDASVHEETRVATSCRR